MYMGRAYYVRTYTLGSPENVHEYPEVWISGLSNTFPGTDFQLISERYNEFDGPTSVPTDYERASFWKLQGDILGSMQ